MLSQRQFFTKITLIGIRNASPIPSGGLEIKLNLTFKGRGDLIDKLKLLLRDAYNWDYTGEQTQDEGNDNEDDDNEENDF